MTSGRVLLLMHETCMPPESLEGLSENEIKKFKAEYDVQEALHENDFDVHPLGVGDELAPIRRAVEEFRPHVAFNLLVDFHGVPLYDANFVSYLELLKTPYTGCNPRSIILASDKALAKKVLSYHRIPVPGFAVYAVGRKARKPRNLDYPLFVKSTVEHASQGISQASIVRDDESLADRVAFVHDTIGTDALAEEYVDGREFTVSIIGNTRLTTFPVWELTFDNLPAGSAPIATSRVKFDVKTQERLGVTIGPAIDLADEKLEIITRLCKRVYKALGMSGYARIDLRMREDGRVFVLEANPNPDISRDEDFAESAAAGGLAYPALIRRIVRLGMSYRAAWKAE